MHPQLICRLDFTVEGKMKIWWCQVRAIWWVIQSGETKTVNLRSCSYTCVWSSLLCRRRSSSMWGQTCESHTFIFPNVPCYFSELMAVPVIINYECTMLSMSEKSVSMPFQADAASQLYWCLHIPIHEQVSFADCQLEACFCSQELCHLHWHTCVTLCHVYKHTLEASSGRSLKFNPKGRCNKLNAVQFVLLYVFLFTKKIRMHYFLEPFPIIHCNRVLKTVLKKFKSCSNISMMCLL